MYRYARSSVSERSPPGSANSDATAGEIRLLIGVGVKLIGLTFNVIVAPDGTRQADASRY
jgi:hypothetical protein